MAADIIVGKNSENPLSFSFFLSLVAESRTDRQTQNFMEGKRKHHD
ncbi:hypothetical protein [Candidatus Nitrosocosmicus franklandus]|nr:hypothetical protein [Candidatus Nitrosocosmicus franklandus]